MNLEYRIKRSARRKRLTITVERDRSVVVHAPESATDEKVREVVDSKRAWIYEKINHRQKYQDATHPPGKELVNGESALYLGRHYRIELVPGRHKEIVFAQKFLIPAWRGVGRRTVLRHWYMDRAEAIILPRVARFAKQLGAEYTDAKLMDNLYRWGSCTPANKLHFNWRLIKAPMYVIDYIIVHELAHLLESNHTPRFWNIIRAQSPHMEKAKVWLKDHGQVLEEAI